MAESLGDFRQCPLGRLEETSPVSNPPKIIMLSDLFLAIRGNPGGPLGLGA